MNFIEALKIAKETGRDWRKVGTTEWRSYEPDKVIYTIYADDLLAEYELGPERAKPFECWVRVSPCGNSFVGGYTTKEEAEKNSYRGANIIHMREVKDE